MPTSRELREERAGLIEQQRALLDAAEADNRDLNADEREHYDRLGEETDRLEARYTRLEQQEEREAELGRHVNEGFRDAPGDGDASGDGDADDGGLSGERYAEAFEGYMTRGYEGLQHETRATLQIDSDVGGGFIAASERFINRMIQAVDEVLVVRQLATKYPCAYGESLGFPSLDGDISDFEFGAGELTEASEDTGLAFGKRELIPRALKRKVVKISKRLLESPRMDAEGIVIDRCSLALARGQETAFMTGSGAAEPLGLFTASADGIPTSKDVSTDMTTTNVSGNGLISVQGALPDQFQAKARWMFHRDGVTKIRKLKDDNGQYLWQPGLQAGQPDLLLAKPIVTGSKVPNTWTAGLYVGMYGDFSHYWIADAVSMVVQRLVEKYALTGQVGLLFDKMAVDGMPVQSDAFRRVKLAAS